MQDTSFSSFGLTYLVDMSGCGPKKMRCNTIAFYAGNIPEPEDSQFREKNQTNNFMAAVVALRG